MRGRARVVLVASLLAAQVLACSETTGPRTGGETHWMRCVSNADCDAPLTCVCGLCAPTCEDDLACVDLGAPSICWPTAATGETGTCQPAPTADTRVCLPTCDGDTDCQGLEEEASCQAGICVIEQPSVPLDMGGPDASQPDVGDAVGDVGGETSDRVDVNGDAGSDARTGTGGGLAECAAWAQAIDAHWGPAPDVEERLLVFDTVWQHIRNSYAAFVTTPWVDWDEVRVVYRPQIEQAESYGQFFRLLSEPLHQLHSLHTWLDSDVVCESRQTKRPPLFVRGFWAMTAGWLGACATPLQDDTMLVYRAEPDNPAGLAPGDLILGYDGVPWRELVTQIEACGLPTCGRQLATDAARDSSAMSSVVLNAHLFESLDVQRYGVAEPESIPTEELIGYTTSLDCTDQMPVEGLDFPWTHYSADRDFKSDVTFGRLAGNLGYIYAYSWHDMVEERFRRVLDELMDTDGLIIDLRFSDGGLPAHSYAGLELLFGEDVQDVPRCRLRQNINNYLALSSCGNESTLTVDAETSYDQPIAILIGPRVAASEVPLYILSQHPRARLFGRPSSGDFAGNEHYALPDDDVFEDFFFHLTRMISIDREGNHLHRVAQVPDTAVWLTQQDVAQGRDTVVEAALAWIAAQNAE